jgi:hypothetical protein
MNDNGLSPLMLQKALVDDTKELLSDFYLKNVDGNLVLPNIYPQHIPVKQKPKDIDHFPYIVLVLNTADDPEPTEPLKCSLFYSIGVFDDSIDYQGYIDAANIIDQIYNHLASKQKFGNFMLQYPINRSYVDIGEGGAVKDNWPFFFTGIETNWTVGKVTESDKFI